MKKELETNALLVLLISLSLDLLSREEERTMVALEVKGHSTQFRQFQGSVGFVLF